VGVLFSIKEVVLHRNFYDMTIYEEREKRG
jgi:hypothetical protein